MDHLDQSFKFQANDFISRRQCEKLESCYRVGEFLGEGAFGAVHSCVHLETGAERAVKIMQKSSRNAKVQQEAIDEYNVLKELDHPNLIRVYELLEDDFAYYIITDLCQGGDMLEELAKFEDEGGSLPEEDAAQVINNLLSCINYCHQKGIVHRDLKLENILLHDSDYNDIKLIDFGLARKFDDPTTRFSELVGTAYYVPPEVLNRDYSSKADLWSLGVIAYMLLGGYPPFDGDDDRETMVAVLRGNFDFDDECWDYVTQEAKDFVQALLVPENLRPTAQQSLQHPWLQNHRAASIKRSSSSTRASLTSLSSFHSRGSILKQATCAMMASQHCHSEEIKDLSRAFQALDQNCCGKLSKADFRACMRAVYQDDSDTSSSGDDFASEDFYLDFDIDAVFEHVNISKTGHIHYSEFLGACLLQKNVLNGTIKLRQVFQTFDKENKGFITRQDLKEALSRNSRICDVTIDKIMREADLSGRGQISFDDFIAIMTMGEHSHSHSCSKSICAQPRATLPFVSSSTVPLKNQSSMFAKGA